MTKRRRNVRTALLATLALALLAWWPLWRLGIGGDDATREDVESQHTEPDRVHGAASPSPARPTEGASELRASTPATRDSFAARSIAADSTAATDETGSSLHASAFEQQPAADAGHVSSLEPSGVALEDRLHGLLEGAEDALVRSDWVSADLALAAAERLPLETTQRARVTLARSQWRRGFADHAARVLGLWRDGRVLEGTALVRPLTAGMASEDGARVRELWRSLDAPDIWLERDQSAAVPDLRSELARGRAVRWIDEHGAIHPAVIVSGDADTISIRVAAGGRVFHPVIARTRVEPVEASVDEALDRAIVALVEEDPLLAVAWLAHARARATAEHTERLSAIERALVARDPSSPTPAQSR